ncbi:Glycosyltransferase involved in cell wall bisynthesis [Acetitomaculum ruminis DSM 5522]|uniref:Glycosyltransferase involved in cell wall bisynthesis n=1 Tax=Acetitomaculum ruminis DSM 5522 TaxID=1120918 RepID=A0A1I0VR01_9FIRM|nr:glycosyltransferase family 2 protein [Acetitomaculum ruminis]SFA78815.1 Glycosyltransferase involved in cell wall bisynthesis [Acetitomaculum ruminis DSM 5522]
MKLLSIAVPCYNSEAYMKNCINSLLPGEDEVEIIIVDDGSKDNTASIADEYEKKYPGIIKVVHQKNGGHGEAVNTGLKNATGLFFKVVDSDDWVDHESYKKILSEIERMVNEKSIVDMIISNYVYEKQGVKHKKVIKYSNAFPTEEIFSWDKIKHLKKDQYILMHSVMYRTKMLRDSGLKLPKHTFYVDNIFVYNPLPFVKSMYYIDVNFYRYYIGREDQSVNEEIMIKRIDQQLKVNQIMINSYDLKTIKDKKLRKYMLSYLEIITVISSILLIKSGTDENLKRKKELWKSIKQKDLWLYKRMRYFSLLGRGVNMPGKGGRKIAIGVYKLAQKFIGFN